MVETPPGGSRARSATAWADAATGALAAVLEHEASLEGVAYSPDGSRLVTASADKTAKVWDARRGALLMTIAGHTHGITSAIFSSSGARVVTTSADHTAKVWDAETGALALELKHRVGLRTDDGALAWPVPPETLTRIGCQRLKQFEKEYAEARELCDPLLDQQPGAVR